MSLSLMVPELAGYLATNIAALSLGTNLFTYVLPDDPNAAFNIRLTSGESDSESPIDRPTFQIMGRGVINDIDTPSDVLQEIFNLLLPARRLTQGLNSEIITANWRFMTFNAIQSPSPLGFDNKGRPLFVFNVEAHVVPVL